MNLLVVNPVNYFKITVESGEHKGKTYLYQESNRRWSLLRAYAKGRPAKFQNEKYLVLSGVKVDLKWAFANYSNSKPFTQRVPIPEVVYDIKKDKVYELMGAIWDFN